MKNYFYIEVYLDGEYQGDLVRRKNNFVKIRKFKTVDTAQRFADKLKKDLIERCTLEVKFATDEVKEIYKSQLRFRKKEEEEFQDNYMNGKEVKNDKKER